MSSGNLCTSSRPDLFLWSADLDPAEYLFATYWIATAGDPQQAAIGMAMEQSAATVHIDGFVQPEPLRGWSIRVRAVRPAAAGGGIPSYSLETEVYPATGPRAASSGWEVELAVPLRLLAGRPGQALNVLVGELPRLGYLTGFRLLDAVLPPEFGPGPAFGADGIRRLAGVPKGPLLCRSMRPGVGLDAGTQARLHCEVLCGGFHLVKDDELACFPDEAAFRAHLRAMLDARDRARDRTGEAKLYIASLLCETEELEARWTLVRELGVDGVLVAPYIQGPSLLRRLAREGRMPILAHNTFRDLLDRPQAWGISAPVLCGWARRLGADWFVTPGPFATPFHAEAATRALMAAVRGPMAGAAPLLPILQGGKNPDGLPAYRAAVGSDDFMLIVASWVDGHPQGLQAGARAFRDAVDG